MAELVASQTGRERLPSGGSELLSLLARLLHRPRRGERRLPVFWLVRAEGAPDFITLLRRAMTRGHRRRVPHAVVDVADQPSDVAGLLRRIHQQLSLEAFGTERLRFRHYALADWLMRQSLSADGSGESVGWEADSEERRVALARRLRDRHGLRRTEADQSAVAEDPVAAASQLVLWLVRRAIPAVLFRVAVTGRVPLFGRHYRWFMRQHYLAPQQSVSFIGFAERLTAGWRGGEQPDQVEKLLVHAFLEDLRQAYRRPLWRPASWRRTAYPLLLLDNVTPDSAGHTLVRLVSDVRNETGRNDPLLVVAVGPGLPPEAPRWDQLSDAEESYEEWVAGLPERRRLRRPAAWLIPLFVGNPSEGSEPQGGLLGFAAPNPPWWSRKLVIGGVSLALVAGGLGWADTRWSPDCVPHPFAGQVRVQLIGDQCIGYSDSAAHVFSTEQTKLADVQRKIFTQNITAEEQWQASGRVRPYVTLVYLGALTGVDAQPGNEAYASEREDLEGLAVTQFGLLEETPDDDVALLRVVVANAGHQMTQADTAVRMLDELIRDDPTVIGVIGLVDSRDSTAAAVRKLHSIGLPTLAPTLSADNFDDNSGMYLQMSAPNVDQARMIYSYVTQVLGLDDAHVYYTTGEGSSRKDDLYVDSLVTDLERWFGDRLSRVQRGRPYSECGYDGGLIFAGRWSEFDDFMRTLRDCGDDPPLHVIADDSVNRYMANADLRRTAPRNVPVTYASKAALATCESLWATTAHPRATFLYLIQHPEGALQDPACVTDSTPPVGERVSLVYDAAMMMVDAVERLAYRLRAETDEVWNPRELSPVAVHAEMLAQAREGFRGVTGLIRFDGSGEPVNRRISLMRVTTVPDADSPAQEVYHCGAADGAARSSDCGAPGS